jgi:hypothetical protein
MRSHPAFRGPITSLRVLVKPSGVLRAKTPEPFVDHGGGLDDGPEFHFPGYAMVRPTNRAPTARSRNIHRQAIASGIC